MKMFSIDGPIYKFMSALTNMFLLNICWLVGTIIGLGTTIGVSTVAAFDIGLKLAENKEGYVVKQFIQAYKKNLKQGFPLGLIALVASYTVYLDFEIFNKVPNATIFLLMWGFLSGAIFFSCLVYAFPLSARYTNSRLRLYDIVRRYNKIFRKNRSSGTCYRYTCPFIHVELDSDTYRNTYRTCGYHTYRIDVCNADIPKDRETEY